MTIKQVTVAGSGVLGSQIAFQAAYKGFDVTINDINDQALENGKLRIQHLASLYRDEINLAKKNKVKKSSQLTIIKTSSQNWMTFSYPKWPIPCFWWMNCQRLSTLLLT